MYVRVCVHIQICEYIHIFTCENIWICFGAIRLGHEGVHNVHIHMHTCIFLCIYVYKYICVWTHIYMCTCVLPIRLERHIRRRILYTYIYMCADTCAYIWMMRIYMDVCRRHTTRSLRRTLGGPSVRH